MSPEISNQEAVQMMNRCMHEIQMLRAQVGELAPKADAYDNICTILALLPKKSQGYGEDLIWTLKKRIEEFTPKPEANPV